MKDDDNTDHEYNDMGRRRIRIMFGRMIDDVMIIPMIIKDDGDNDDDDDLG